MIAAINLHVKINQYHHGWHWEISGGVARVDGTVVPVVIATSVARQGYGSRAEAFKGAVMALVDIEPGNAQLVVPSRALADVVQENVGLPLLFSDRIAGPQELRGQMETDR